MPLLDAELGGPEVSVFTLKLSEFSSVLLHQGGPCISQYMVDRVDVCLHGGMMLQQCDQPLQHQACLGLQLNSSSVCLVSLQCVLFSP